MRTWKWKSTGEYDGFIIDFGKTPKEFDVTVSYQKQHTVYRGWFKTLRAAENAIKRYDKSAEWWQQWECDSDKDEE